MGVIHLSSRVENTSRTS